MKILKAILLSAVIALISISCDSPSTAEFKTQEVSIEELNQTPGFIWFQANYRDYDSNPAVIEDIKKTIQKDDVFYLFAMPTCDCKFTQYYFPHAVRVLTDAGIPTNQYKIIVLKDKDAQHPYSDFLKLKDLPEVFLVRNNPDRIFYISDTVKVRSNDSTHIKKGSHRVEKVILEALLLK